MCGILGSVSKELPVAIAHQSLFHRGPDEQTDWSDGQVQFIHTRLAIQELSPAGRQPMAYKQFRLVFNGEIYNHQELRKKFNLQCGSNSDSETLLHLFEQMGIGMLSELDGMFALAIYDESQKQLWIARDRAGEKPMYYSATNDTLVFGSELLALTKILTVEVDDRRIANFIASGYLLASQTPYKNINELPGGHFLFYDLNVRRPVIKQWWSVDPFFKKRFNGTLDEALEEADRMLRYSVTTRMISSDLEVGTFLSGGIDSGIVTAMAAETNRQLKSFTISFDGFYDEGPPALVTARHLKTDHRQITISLNDIQHDLERIFVSYGEPIIDDSIIPSYYVCREARRYLTVVLNGDGGDELFGGYRRYVPFATLNMFNNYLTGLFRSLRAVLPYPSEKISIYNYLYRLAAQLSVNGPNAYYVSTNDLMHARTHNFVVKPDLAEHNAMIESILFSSSSPLKKIMNMDFNLILHNILLGKMDIASMNNSLETRSPFLSRDLMEFMPSLPDHFLVNGRETKFLLRKLAKKYLPNEIVNRPKRGFEIPLQDWIDGRIKDITHDYLSRSNAYTRTILKPEFVDRLLRNKVDMPQQQRARILFALLSVECWKSNLSV